jgi:RNA polymerase sigma-70 factor, ECF subfamily
VIAQMTGRRPASTSPSAPYPLGMERRADERSDAALVVAIGRFQQEALAEAYARHGNSVFALARRVLRDRDLAEEVTQEVFLRLWNRPERFDPERGSLRSFLLADTHGRSVDLLRAEAARRNREEREAKLDVSPGYDLEAEITSRAVSRQVREALEALSDDERRAIVLAYYGGHSYREVAELLGQPEGTIKSRIRAGMKRLHTQLVASGVSPA